IINQLVVSVIGLSERRFLKLIALSDHIREGLFHTPEIKCSGYQNKYCREGRNGDDWTRRCLCSQQGPAKALDYANHRIQTIESTPGFMKQAARVSNRRNKQPELCDEGNDIAHVAIFDI